MKAGGLWHHNDMLVYIAPTYDNNAVIPQLCRTLFNQLQLCSFMAALCLWIVAVTIVMGPYICIEHNG